MKFKKVLSLAAAAVLMTSMAGCGNKDKDNGNKEPNATPTAEAPATDENEQATVDFKVGMVTDVGGVNDQSFNQSAWEGLKDLQAKYGVEVKYIESSQAADYEPNLDRLVDENTDLIWGIGFLMGDSILNAAKQNPDVLYGIVDYAYEEGEAENTIGVLFKSEQPSFLVGYIAAKTTETDKIGFIGGIKGNIIDQFEYGYRAGAAYASKELGKDIEVLVQYADSFDDVAIGRAIANNMYTNDADIIFHAAGKVGVGLIEEAKERNKYAIGVDSDQAYLAPDNILTSALKNVGHAMSLLSKDIMDGKGEELGGTTQVYDIVDGGVGLSESPLVAEDVLTDVKNVEQLLIDGTIDAPANEEEFNLYLETLK